MLPKPWLIAILVVPLLLPAQERSDFQQILQRLEQLERQNRNLADEVHALRAEIASSHPVTGNSAGAEVPDTSAGAPVNVSPVPIEERLSVQEQRTEEFSQTKVEAAQRMPVTLTGMLLFNTFLNSRANGGAQDPLVATSTANVSGGGAGLSQSIVGLRFEGPRVLGGGRIRGSIDVDLWGGSTSALNHLVRLRIAAVQIDWKNSSLMVGQDKPLVAPHDPDSLAQVAFSPLTAAGNLWLWQPQIRFEQRFAIGDNAGLKAQASVYQTSEPSTSAGPDYQARLAPASPALEGRFELWGKYASGARIEVGPGFHVSDTHVADLSIPSRLFTLDWMLQPLAKVRVSGAFFHGRNAAGLGGLRQGFTVTAGPERFLAVRATGGWAQFSLLATPRLTFNAYGGQESNHAADLLASQIARNFVYAGNAQYRMGPNVLLGLEASQTRTAYVGGLLRLVNHYDLALAYLF
jgi:hypothetical protein